MCVIILKRDLASLCLKRLLFSEVVCLKDPPKIPFEKSVTLALPIFELEVVLKDLTRLFLNNNVKR